MDYDTENGWWGDFTVRAYAMQEPGEIIDGGWFFPTQPRTEHANEGLMGVLAEVA